MNIKIDFKRDRYLSEFSIKTLQDRYLVNGETSPQQAFARAAKAFADDEAHAQRLYDYASKLWFMFSTPILSNGGTTRGLPISCFLNYVDDSRTGITGHYTENAFLSSVGGGVGGYWGDVRSVGSTTSAGSESTGVIPFVKVVDAEMLAFSQGVTRRGSYAAYLPMNHPEIEEFLDVRKPTGGDINRKSTNLHHGVVVPDSFMELIEGATISKGFDDSWDLIDPHSGIVTKTVSAKTLWVKLIQNRVETGEPYIMFGDTVQEALPDCQKDLGLEVHQSNLCSEITLPTNEERTAVCCLSSVNLEEFDEWSNDIHFIPDLVRMLDNVITHFIRNAPDELEKARFSAERERSIGLEQWGFMPTYKDTIFRLNQRWRKDVICLYSGTLNLSQKLLVDSLRWSEEMRLMHMAQVCVIVIYWLLLQMLHLVLSVVTRVLVLSLTVLMHMHKKLKAVPLYKRTNIWKIYSEI